MKQRILEAEKRIKELLNQGELKKLSEHNKQEISVFYEKKSLSRLKSAKLIFNHSTEQRDYSDYSEVVSAAYYSMYYIVHSFLALKYQRKLREGLRGVHAITAHLVLYYLVKTNQLSKYLYEEYINTLETVAEVDNITLNDFEQEAYSYAEKYKSERNKRERFTYFVSRNAEEHHAKVSLDVAEKFINILRELIRK